MAKLIEKLAAYVAGEETALIAATDELATKVLTPDQKIRYAARIAARAEQVLHLRTMVTNFTKAAQLKADLTTMAQALIASGKTWENEAWNAWQTKTMEHRMECLGNKDACEDVGSALGKIVGLWK